MFKRNQSSESKKRKQHVIVMNSDPLVLKGLALLLKDMDFEVSAVSNDRELEALNKTPTNCPDLLIFQYLVENGTPGISFANRLRGTFAKHIPTILLDSLNSPPDTNPCDAGTMVLSECIKPRVLRQKIGAILACCEKENRHG